MKENLNIHSEFISEDLFGINEVQRFKWKEGVLYSIQKKQALTGDEEEACRRYNKLAQLVAEIED